jgi:mannose-6-phosphate isomerase-like protein (cupin superfamily)
LHYHEDMQEIFVLLKGEVEMHVGKTMTIMHAGDTVIVAPREPHRMVNCLDEVAEYIVFGISSGQNGKTVVIDG